MAEKLSPKDLVEIWKIVIQVQQHFNTIEMTVRNIFATIVVALIAGVGYSVKEKLKLTLFLGVDVSLSSVLCLAAFWITCLFYFVDRYWYHRLLLGSVKEGLRLEEEISKHGDVSVHLGQQINAISPIEVSGWRRRLLSFIVAEKRLHNEGRLHSDGKIEIFYKSIMVMFALLMILTAAAI